MKHTVNGCTPLLPKNRLSRPTGFISSSVRPSPLRLRVRQELKTLARFHLLALILNSTPINVGWCIHSHAYLVTQSNLNFCDGVPGQRPVNVVGSVDNIDVAVAIPRALQAISTPLFQAVVKESKHLTGLDLSVPGTDPFAIQKHVDVATDVDESHRATRILSRGHPAISNSAQQP